jgi:hypothetical protein
MPCKGVFTLHLMLEFQVVQGENTHARLNNARISKESEVFNEF